MIDQTEVAVLEIKLTLPRIYLSWYASSW